MDKKELMLRACQLAEKSVRCGGGPFGALITKNGEIIAEGNNCVTINHDPTAHAEITAIRKATEFSFTTRSRPHNGGIGLDNVISSCSDTDELFIISNKGQIIVQNNNMSTFALDYEFPGTLIFYRISIAELPDIDNDDLDDVYI